MRRLVDEAGQPMGPHRVWLQYAWIPGLAMSRALGDVLAHQCACNLPQLTCTEPAMLRTATMCLDPRAGCKPRAGAPIRL
jgi:hypothetical protein